jgi:hypothetical protein
MHARTLQDEAQTTTKPLRLIVEVPEKNKKARSGERALKLWVEAERKGAASLRPYGSAQ